MAFGCWLNPETGVVNDDHLVAKAFEALRCEFGKRIPDFQGFVAANVKRAFLVLEVEGRNTNAVVNALRPFAEGACDMWSRGEADREFRRQAIRKGAGQ